TPNLEWTRKQFFMAIHDCSKEFTLPVVALHNNSISDTAELRKELKAKEKKDADAAAKALKEGKPAPAASDPFEGVPRDLDKPVDPPKGKPVPVVEAMKKALRDRFGEKAQKALTDTPRITNIFRWCAASELSRCHAGDPENPDNVVWVTNEADFKTLSSQKVNVVLQTSVGKESVGDLSSMFLEIEKQIGEEAVALLTPLWNEVDWGDVLAPEFGEKLARIDRIVDESQKKIESLRFVNVETPAKQSDSSTPMWLHVVEQYRAIVATLKPLGLHCCKQDPALLTSPEENVKMGIKAALQPPEPKKKKKPAAKK
ncbi:MAG TPA: hypothetical protein VFR81_17685, partial [Longimicrobium sp.]|nr:hypothetical protein [Longimicrobium sp.]